MYIYLCFIYLKKENTHAYHWLSFIGLPIQSAFQSQALLRLCATLLEEIEKIYLTIFWIGDSCGPPTHGNAKC